MNVTHLRTLLRKYGAWAAPVVGVCLLFHALRRRKRIAFLGVALLLITALSINSRNHPNRRAPAAAPSEAGGGYTITDLGTLKGYAKSFAAHINNRGQVVGSVSNGSRQSRPVLWQDGKLIALDIAGMQSGNATSINEKGVIVGGCDESLRKTFAVQWQNGKIRVLESLGGDHALATRINASGQICGEASQDHSPDGEAVLWENGKIRSLGFRTPRSHAAGINDAGEIVGTVTISQIIYEAFRYHEGKSERLASLGGYGDAAFAINNRGQIAGHSEYEDHWEAHAALWTNGKVRDLGTLGGKESSATEINNNGDVVGWSQDPLGAMRPFLWRQGKMTDLNALLPRNSGWMLEGVAAINDRGQIVGTGRHNGQTRAFLLTPES